MDSVHVSTPMLKCVDVLMNLAGSRGARVIRVLACSRVDVHASTLRVGSPDGLRSMHIDEEQMADVVKPLARWFGIKPYSRTVNTLVEHSYVECEPTAASVDDSSEHHSEFSIRRASGKKGSNETEEQPVVVEEGEAHAYQHDLERANEVLPTLDESGAYLNHKPRTIVRHVARIDHRPSTLHLPFDVEVHQLPNGQRMVLDTLRLLIPDVAWMYWMRSDEAKPILWCVPDVSTDADFSQSQIVTGWDSPVQLRQFAHGSNGQPDLSTLSKMLFDWSIALGSSSMSAAAAAASSVSSAQLSFPVDRMKVNADTGCVTVQGV